MEKFHAIVPRVDCPHIAENYNVNQLLKINLKDTKEILSNPCLHCDESYENWVCLFCGTLQCSRYKNGHMKDHHEETGHPFVLSLADFSCWCYECGDYIWSPNVKNLHDTIYLARFDEPPQKYSDDIQVLNEKTSQLSDWIKKSRKIVFFTGNGINTAALIPKPNQNSPQQESNKENRSLFDQSSSTSKIELQEMEPTFTHNALKKITELPNTSHMIISTNLDNLHEQTGIDDKIFHKINYKVTEDVLNKDLSIVMEKTQNTDLFIVVGSSMRTSPSNKIPELVKLNGGKLIIINAQNTPYDSNSVLRIWSSPDKAFKLICEAAKIDVEE